ncbi:hypothetical protein [Streptomyces sp. NRRL F-5630]|uniref:hypothetical protein n=1 Tax=unclassified Streptomyces TaxID=2593676 RepID=UPI0005645D52|nr:hypothetical protein [Streptomyces sp. NRRL F-5630]
MTLRVQILLYDGAEEQDFTGPRDVLGWAAHESADVSARYVRASGPGEVTTLFGTRLIVPDVWEPEAGDVVIVPGGD